MTKVRIVKDWEFPDWFRQTPGSRGIWNEVEFTEAKITSFDYLVVLNSIPYKIKGSCPTKNRWLLTQEPPVKETQWFSQHFHHFNQVFSQHDFHSESTHIINSQTCLPWHINKSYDQLKKLGIGDKEALLSTVTSNLYHFPGHKARYDLIQYLKNLIEIQLYGRGFNFIDDKFDAIYPFKYSIAIENSFTKDYWTEKLADCFLSWTMPIYAGATNILDYFPKESMIIINPNNKEESLDIIKDAIQQNLWSKNIDAIAFARELILEKYQFFPFISKTIAQNDCNELPSQFKIPQSSEPKISLINRIKNRVIRYYE